MLRQHDPVLRKHLVDINVDAQSYAWLLLRSLFTEVLTRYTTLLLILIGIHLLKSISLIIRWP
jgi:hypothetical protein